MDDVICNTLECGLGVLANWIGRVQNYENKVIE